MKSSVKKPLRKVLLVVLILVCVVCLVQVGLRLRDYQLGDTSYAQAETIAQLPQGEEESDTLPQDILTALSDLDLDSLREVNPDVLGWIYLPDSPINYPLVQTDNDEYYLNHAWDNTATAVGAIFMEYQSSPDFSDFNTIIYGHRMGNDSMFHCLANFKDQDYWQAHPTLYVANEEGIRAYDIFAAYEVSVQGSAYQLLRAQSGQEAKEAFLEDALSASVIDTGLTPTAEDQVLTLSTCTGRGHATRWVVQGVERGLYSQDLSGLMKLLS